MSVALHALSAGQVSKNALVAVSPGAPAEAKAAAEFESQLLQLVARFPAVVGVAAPLHTPVAPK
jgi:hypothetical protein